MARFVLKYVDSGPEDLRSHLPIYGALLFTVTGQRHDDCWLAQLDQSIRYHPPAELDRKLLHPLPIHRDPDGDFVWIHQFLISTRLADSAIQAGARSVPVHIHYVIDITARPDGRLDYDRTHYIGTGVIDEISLTVAPPLGPTDAPPPPAAAAEPPGVISGHAFRCQLDVTIAQLATLARTHPRSVPGEGAHRASDTGAFYVIEPAKLTYHTVDPEHGPHVRDTTDPDELLYWIVDDLARGLAYQAATTNSAYSRAAGNRRNLWLLHWAYLMAAISPQWGERTYSRLATQIEWGNARQ